MVVPKLIRKRETILAESLESKILGTYSLGMSLRDISKHIKDMYDTDISHATLSAITDTIIPEVKEWQFRPPVRALYDAMHYKVKEMTGWCPKVKELTLVVCADRFAESRSTGYPDCRTDNLNGLHIEFIAPKESRQV